MFLYFDFEFLLRAKSEISPKDTAEKSEILFPKIYVFAFWVRIEFIKIIALVERSGKFKIRRRAERAHYQKFCLKKVRTKVKITSPDGI